MFYKYFVIYLQSKYLLIVQDNKSPKLGSRISEMNNMKIKSLIQICYIISAITAIIGVWELANIAILSYEMGKDSTDTFMWYFLVRGIQAWGIICNCIVFLILANKAAKAIIFTKANESLLMISGSIIIALGSISFLLIKFLPISSFSNAASILLIVEGVAFIFFSLIFSISRKLKEEQDLTI